MDYTSFNTYFGPWHNVTHAYLGLKFSIKGKIHFGWASLTTITPGWPHGITATLTGYAYETIPKKPIITGKTKGADDSVEQPATLGRLALGRK